LVETAVIAGVRDVGLPIVEATIERIGKYRKLKAEKETYIRLIYLEVIRNLEAFEVFNFDAISGAKLDDRSLKVFLGLLSTEMLEGIFYGGEAEADSHVYNELAGKKGYFRNKDSKLFRLNEKGEEVEAKNSFYEHVLQAISFVITKIAILKQLEKLSVDDQEAIKKVNLKIRLVNIQKRLQMIKSKFNEFDDIKAMAR
jgi:hypothetical protein